MSGGQWDYENYRILDVCRRVSEDEKIIQRFPILSSEIMKLGLVLDKILHDLDWDLSGDTCIKNDEEFENAALAQLKT